MLRRAGVNVRGMLHNTALDGAVPVAAGGSKPEQHRVDKKHPAAPAGGSTSITMSRSVTDLGPDEEFMGGAGDRGDDKSSIASGDTRSVTAGRDVSAQKGGAHSDDDSAAGVTRLRFPSSIPRRVRVMLQGLRPADREAYQTRVRNLYAQEMRVLFRHFNRARKRANKAAVFSNDINIARAMAKASLPAAALGGVLLPATLLRDLVLRDMFLRFQLRDFVLDARFRNADSTLALGEVMQELPRKCAALFRQVAALFPWLESVIPVGEGASRHQSDPSLHGKGGSVQDSSEQGRGGPTQGGSIRVHFEGGLHEDDPPPEEPHPTEAVTGEGVLLRHLAALGVAVHSLTAQRDQQLKRDVSREFVARVKSTRWLVTGAYKGAVRKLEVGARRRVGAVSGRLNTAGSARRGGSAFGAVSTAADAADDMAMAISGVGGGGKSSAAGAPEVQALDGLLGSPLDEGIYRPGGLVRRLLRQARAASSAVASAVTSAAGVRRKRRRRRRAGGHSAAARHGVASSTPSKDVGVLAQLVQGGDSGEGGAAWRLAYNKRLAASIELRSSIQPKAMVPRHLYMAPPAAGRSTAKSRGVADATAARTSAKAAESKASSRAQRAQQASMVSPHLRELQDRAQSRLGLPTMLRSGDGPTPAQSRLAAAQRRRTQQLHGTAKRGATESGVAAATGLFGPSLEGVQALAGGGRARGAVTLAQQDTVQPKSAVYIPSGQGGESGAAVRRAVSPAADAEQAETSGSKKHVTIVEGGGDFGEGGTRGPTEFRQVPGVAMGDGLEGLLGGVDATPFHIGEHVGGVHESHLGGDSFGRDDAWLAATHQRRMQAKAEAEAEAAAAAEAKAKAKAEAEVAAEAGKGSDSHRTRGTDEVNLPGIGVISEDAIGRGGSLLSPSSGGGSFQRKSRRRRRQKRAAAKGVKGGRAPTGGKKSENVILRALDGGTMSAAAVAADTSLAPGIRGAAARVAAAQAAPASLGDAARLDVRRWAEATGAVHSEGGVALISGAPPPALGHLMLHKSASAAVGLTRDELPGWGGAATNSNGPGGPRAGTHVSQGAVAGRELGGPSARSATSDSDFATVGPAASDEAFGVTGAAQVEPGDRPRHGAELRGGGTQGGTVKLHRRELQASPFKAGSRAGASRDALLARAALSHTQLPAFLRGREGADAALAEARREAAGACLRGRSQAAMATAMSAGGRGGVALAQRKRLAEGSRGGGAVAGALTGGGLPRLHLHAMLQQRTGQGQHVRSAPLL